MSNSKLNNQPPSASPKAQAFLLQEPQVRIIKGLSISIIFVALCLDLWSRFGGLQFPAQLAMVLLGGRIILFAHLVEAIIAAIAAFRRDQSPLRYGLYTFWVGFIGLSELFAPQRSPEKS